MCDLTVAALEVPRARFTEAVVPLNTLSPTWWRFEPPPTPPVASSESTRSSAACWAQYIRTWPPLSNEVSPMLPDRSMISSTSRGLRPQPASGSAARAVGATCDPIGMIAAEATRRAAAAVVPADRRCSRQRAVGAVIRSPFPFIADTGGPALSP